MLYDAIWISGPSRSGKTTRLIELGCDWIEQQSRLIHSSQLGMQLVSPKAPGVLALAAIGDNRIDLSNRLIDATHGNCSIRITTPLGFFEEEVRLFWALLVQQLSLQGQYPLRLTPETEQELATQLWQAELDPVLATGGNGDRLVRRLLDLLQLAALAGIPIADIPTILTEGLAAGSMELGLVPSKVETLLTEWQDWCLTRGLVTYGLVAALYGQHLLPHPTYQQHLHQRYGLVLADDVDDYPAIARSLFDVLLEGGASGIFTHNPAGCIRLGLGADPTYLAELADRCRVETLLTWPQPNLGEEFGSTVVNLALNPMAFTPLPSPFQIIQAVSRAELLRRTAQTIVDAVQTQQIQPVEIAVIAPGLDTIARYSLMEILSKHGIVSESLNDQRPLTSFVLVRSLLTLLTLIYPNLGHLVNREAVAEMLMVLSQGTGDRTLPTASSGIDPVRAGLLADHCFVPHPERPWLLPATTFPRWDRLGYQASAAYQDILDWIAAQQTQLQQRLIPSVLSLLDRAIQKFFLGGGSLPFDSLSAIRQLMETAQHYWEVSDRLSQHSTTRVPVSMILARFIQLLRSGAITANPYPVRPTGPASNAITLANVFQYRSSHRTHRWQFWLDVGSPRWLSGVDSLFGAPLFLQSWSGRAWTMTDQMSADEARLQRILLDLLARTSERVYLCHSELATSGQEQTGGLISLVNASPIS